MKRLGATVVLMLAGPLVLLFFAWLGFMAGLGAMVKAVIDVWQHGG